MLFHFSPYFVIQSYKNKFPGASLEVTKFSVHELVRNMLIVNEKYSIETVENTLHYLINRQVMSASDSEHLHSYITTNIREIYDDHRDHTSICSICSICL